MNEIVSKRIKKARRLRCQAITQEGVEKKRCPNRALIGTTYLIGTPWHYISVELKLCPICSRAIGRLV